ncbi:DNA oxidative demethylase AlkB [Acidihalobacter ferrooxydans]|uniref:Alpha-ketoglutarate-dependent dioxygenase AlkB n=1 Tax=Acidihalobacter ferrooxydans TaxID=1765967 RepID=A0A1P8UI84_9GAMM|nr:DNA oxidative demethylase AlkB [Acidihalobacter ferrooxydans]APZ43539.1 alpha-ketoglutarate-dependent dioxygenase AlkB [Acidihalobacter ferrooxydans]
MNPSLPVDLLADAGIDETRIAIAPGAVLLRKFAEHMATPMLAAIGQVITQAPMRHMYTPGGRRMSVAMSNCGTYGWVTDQRGYRYTRTDPVSGKAWPPMPDVFREMARKAAEQAGYSDFNPDACLINRYMPGSRMALHQDKDEHDFSAPIVSMSFGLDATFLFGGPRRTDRPQRIPLGHGDVLVWGGPSRLHYHGITPLASGNHALTGDRRINLTLRRAR